MVENLEVIKIMGKKFKFVQKKNNKLVYQNVDKELEEIYVMEIEFSESEQKIKKIDVFIVQDEETIGTIHINRGIDGITEIDYFTSSEEYIVIDGEKKLYNVNIYKTYSELVNTDSEIYELELTKKGHKKHKILIKKDPEETLYVTKGNNRYDIKSQSVDKLKRLTQFLTPEIAIIEKELFYGQTQEKIIEEETEILIEDAVEKYPLEMYIYDRNYTLIGIKEKTLIYRNIEDDITELEIYFKEDGYQISEIRFVNYEDIELEGVKHRAKRRIIRMLTTEDNFLKATLVNRKKESMIISGHSLDKTIIRAEAIVDLEKYAGKILTLDLDIKAEGVNIRFKKSPTQRMNFIDENGEIYTVGSNSYAIFRSLISYGPAIIKNLENKFSNVKTQKKVLMKK